MRLFFDIACSRVFDSRYMTICFAFAVSVTTWKLSPTSGSASRPITSTGGGRLGFAHLLAEMVVHRANFAEHLAADEEVADPQRSVLHQDGRHRTASAVELRFQHRSDARTRRDSLSGLRFRRPAETFSSNRSRFSSVFADTGTMTVSPPQSSASRPRSASCCLIRSGCAPGLSILLIATMIGTLAALA